MSCFMLNENITTDLLSNNDRRAVMDSGSIIFMKGMKCYATLSNDDILAVLNTARETTPSPPPAAASTVVVYQLVTPQGQYGARVGFVLLPPCDRTIPVVQGGSSSFQINNSSIAALSNVARVFENRVRQPFRDNKLTLYLRPFLFSTTTVLIGCLPPYDDSLPSVPAIYSVKPAPGPKRLSRFVEAKPKMSNLQPTKNTENFATILRYCARFRGHSISDPNLYRSKEEMQHIFKKDPILFAKNWFIQLGILSEEDFLTMRQECKEEVLQAFAKAKTDPDPDIATLEEGVYA